MRIKAFIVTSIIITIVFVIESIVYKVIDLFFNQIWRRTNVDEFYKNEESNVERDFNKIMEKLHVMRDLRLVINESFLKFSLNIFLSGTFCKIAFYYFFNYVIKNSYSNKDNMLLINYIELLAHSFNLVANMILISGLIGILAYCMKRLHVKKIRQIGLSIVFVWIMELNNYLGLSNIFKLVLISVILSGINRFFICIKKKLLYIVVYILDTSLVIYLLNELNCIKQIEFILNFNLFLLLFVGGWLVLVAVSLLIKLILRT